MQRRRDKVQIRRRITYANVMSTIAVFLTLGGASALAAGQLAKNSVGSRQLKSKSITTGKIANNAVTGAKVAKSSLTGADINVGALGTVPSATTAVSANNANTVGNHAASCPPATILIRGVCFDASSNGPVESAQVAADACALKGGWLPTPLELYTTRNVLNLGNGVGSENQFTDEIYGNTAGANYRTVVVNGTGTITEIPSEATSEHYTCAYPLVR